MESSNLVSEIREYVEETCKKESNFFTYSSWTDHIVKVVMFAKQMAVKLKADIEIVEISALLHDIASVTDYDLYEDHHLHGAEIAEKILKKYNYPQERIDRVKDCILNHRGSVPKEKLSVEEICIADADAMAHFDSVDSLFKLALVIRKLSVQESRDFVMGKLERSWAKLGPIAQEIVRERYKSAKVLFP